MYIESGGEKSTLARNGNNYFGIKCTSDCLAAGKAYSLHNDDRPNGKFCNYASVEESIEHHSQFLMGRRYAGCRQCACDDYRGWAYGLSKYDQQAKQMGSLPREGQGQSARVNQNYNSGNLTPQQQANAQAGAQLSAQTGSNDPNTWLAYLMGQDNAAQYANSHEDLFTSLISGLFTAAIGMAVMLDNTGKDHGETTQTQQQQQRNSSASKHHSTVCGTHPERCSYIREGRKRCDKGQRPSIDT